MVRQIDKVDRIPTQELLADTQVLLHDLQEQEKEKAHIQKNYREILASFDAAKLQRIITKLYLGKTTAQIQQHSSHDLVAQLCLDYLGFDHTQVDSAIGSKSKEAIVLLKGMYNRLLYKNIPLVGAVDADFFHVAFQLLQSQFVFDKTNKQTQQLVAELTQEKKINELRYNERGMIMNRNRSPTKFMREIGSKPLAPEFVGKVFYIGTGKNKDAVTKTVQPKKHVFWHGSTGDSASTLMHLYKTADVAYAILENGAIVCFYDEGKGTGALNGNKGNVFGDPKAHSNGIAVEFAVPTQKKTATFSKKGKTRTERYTDTKEPNAQQIYASQCLLNQLEARNGPLNVGTSAAGWMSGSSTHTDTIGWSNRTLRALRVNQDFIQENRQYVDLTPGYNDHG